jgi:MGT family glycosyltransferase
MNLKHSKKILFANVPADGHFNPLTGLAVFLKEKGYDVRWYSSETYLAKIARLGITSYPFKKALEVNSENLEAIFPERKHINGKIGKLNFDLQHYFIRRAPEYYADIKEIYEDFPFDLMIADCLFTGIPFVKELMKIPVLSIGIAPLMETSKDLAPAGLGMHPASSAIGRVRQAVLRWTADNILFRKSNRIMHELFDSYRIPHNRENFFDMGVRKASLLLQSGTPGFEYKRSDLSEHIRFIGPLLPHASAKTGQPWFDSRLNKYERVVLVTQGTVEQDVTKLLVPTLQALRNSNYLVVVTTGGNGTKDLKASFTADNFIIEDFIAFDDIMPYTDVYVTNGGYGGVMLGIEHQLPMVVAGIHEGKLEINARIGYFKLGKDLRTERPTPAQLRQAIEEVLANGSYRRNVQALGREFNSYDPLLLTERYVKEILLSSRQKMVMVDDNAMIY